MLTDETIARLSDDGEAVKILVLGDIILDQYTWGDVDRVSPEAPVPVLRAARRAVSGGGAASVALLLRALGAQVRLCGVVGNDAGGRAVARLLDQAGVQCDLVVEDAARPTTIKKRFFGRVARQPSQAILRVDRESCDPIPIAIESALAETLHDTAGYYQAILISDYAKGMCAAGLLGVVMTAARQAGVPVLVDPSSSQDYRAYDGGRVIVPNRSEASHAAHMRIDSPDAALRAGARLCDEYGFAVALVKIDVDGLVLVDRGRGVSRHLAAHARAVRDVTGAGDTVLAMAGVCLARRGSLLETARLANLAASLQVEKMGVAPIGWAEIRTRLRGVLGATKVTTLEEMTALADAHRAAGRKIVLTNGCFDLLHAGHVTCLQEAAQLGDVLVVAINDDQSVRRHKGGHRPITGQAARAAIVAALRRVDHVLVFGADTPRDVIRAIRPDVLVKGGTYRPDEVVGADIVRAYGGAVRVTRVVEGVSTSAIIAAIEQQAVAAAGGAERA